LKEYKVLSTEFWQKLKSSMVVEKKNTYHGANFELKWIRFNTPEVKKYSTIIRV
jgi:hypothetical protein